MQIIRPTLTRPNAGFDLACREAGAASAGEFGAVEVADIHLAMVQNGAAAGVDQQGRVERLWFGRLQKSRDDIH
jgi:hypothetical protein